MHEISKKSRNAFEKKWKTNWSDNVLLFIFTILHLTRKHQYIIFIWNYLRQKNLFNSLCTNLEILSLVVFVNSFDLQLLIYNYLPHCF